MITRAIIANRLTDNNVNTIRSVPSIITEKFTARNLQKKTSARFQTQTQTTSVILSPGVTNTETTENIFPTEVTGISIQNSSLIRNIAIAKQTPTKTIRSDSDIQIDPKTSEKFTSQDNSSGVTCHQFQFQNTAKIRFFSI